MTKLTYTNTFFFRIPIESQQQRQTSQSSVQNSIRMRKNRTGPFLWGKQWCSYTIPTSSSPSTHFHWSRHIRKENFRCLLQGHCLRQKLVISMHCTKKTHDEYIVKKVRPTYKISENYKTWIKMKFHKTDMFHWFWRSPDMFIRCYVYFGNPVNQVIKI